MLVSVIILGVSLLVLWAWRPAHLSKLEWKVKKFLISANAAVDFQFRMKSGDRMDAFRKIYRLYPRYFHLDLPFFRVLMVYDSEIAKRIYSSSQCCQRPFGRFIQLEKGLLASSYHDWREPRKLLNAAFNLNVLKGFIPIFSEHTDTAISSLERHLPEKTFNLAYDIALLVARTVSATILNVNLGDFSDFHEVFDSVNIVTDCVFRRIANPFYHVDFIYQLTSIYRREMLAREILMEYAGKLINAVHGDHSMDENANRTAEDDTRPRIKFVADQILNNRKRFSDEDIKEHLMTLLLTASDTTTNMTSASILFMALKQDIQQRVFEEVCDVLGEECAVDYEKLCRLHYLERVLKETLRVFSPLPISMREAIADFDIGTDSTIKRGTNIYILSYVLHSRSDIWGEDSQQFNPDNFTEERASARDAYSYVPFGAGRRSCIGQQYSMIAGKIFVAKLIRSYRFRTELREEDMKLQAGFVAKLGREYSVTIEKRN